VASSRLSTWLSPQIPLSRHEQTWHKRQAQNLALERKSKLLTKLFLVTITVVHCSPTASNASWGLPFQPDFIDDEGLPQVVGAQFKIKRALGRFSIFELKLSCFWGSGRSGRKRQSI
jgi:hypothetical protein